MKSKYWIKLYHEILDDPKMGRMPDNLWRRTIELFLLAGEMDQNGLLSDIDDISWRLRQPVELLENELNQLIKLGILTKTPDNLWLVVNFAIRQAKVSDSERQQRSRDRRRRLELSPPEMYSKVVIIRKRNVTYTVTVRDTDTEVDTDIDITTITKDAALYIIDNLCRQHFANADDSQSFQYDLKETIKTYGYADTLEAICIAISPERANGRPKQWGYVKGILKKGIDSKKEVISNGRSQGKRQTGDGVSDSTAAANKLGEQLSAAFKSRARTAGS